MEALELLLPDGRVQGCDNGLCFAVEPKLRTVLWRWRGQPLTDEERTVLERLHEEMAGRLGDELVPLLTPAEVRATIAGSLAADNPVKPVAWRTAQAHLATSLPHVAGDYMGEHWLGTALKPVRVNLNDAPVD